MILDRYHGLGNDYLVLREGVALTSSLVRAICDRHTGAGGDGILEPAEAGPGDLGVRIWNPDGSVAEKSGNGLRIFARWVVDQDRLDRRAFDVWTGACLARCEVFDDRVRVDMGAADFRPEAVPVLTPDALVDAELPDAPFSPCTVTVLSLGNPHCVLFVDQDPDTVPWRAWGEALERHARFPQRTNVQVAQVTGPQRVQVRIWERGAGPTLASGSSATAVVAAAVRTGRLAGGLVQVDMPGGSVTVTAGPDGLLWLEGAVERVGFVTMDTTWLSSRGATEAPRLTSRGSARERREGEGS